MNCYDHVIKRKGKVICSLPIENDRDEFAKYIYVPENGKEESTVYFNIKQVNTVASPIFVDY